MNGRKSVIREGQEVKDKNIYRNREDKHIMKKNKKEKHGS